jgi:hypothetical protein
MHVDLAGETKLTHEALDISLGATLAVDMELHARRVAMRDCEGLHSYV